MDTEETPAAPRVPAELFEELRQKLAQSGPAAAIDQLCTKLLQAEDYQNYFYAKLMQKRVELGVSPFPMGPATELPSHTHEAYEEAIRQTGREVGQILLNKRDIPRAWTYFRILGEPEPVRQALETFIPQPGEDTYGLVEVAWQQQVHPKKGFELILESHGICSAITMVHSSDLSQQPALRQHCIQKLIHAMHAQLKERLQNDLRGRGVNLSESESITTLVEKHPELFVDDAYHIDVSHLSSIVQMALHLPACPELHQVQELCEYGARLSVGLRGDNDPPFQDTYKDYLAYVKVVNGIEVEAGLAHFAKKAEEGRQEGYQYPAEVYVNLLVKISRLAQALQAARDYLSDANDRELSCPGVVELAKLSQDFATLSEVAQQKSDPVTFLAGLIASR
jgi:hypothetical protein